MHDFISKIWSFVKLAYGTVQPKVVAVPMQAWLVIGFGAACFLGGCVCAKADEPALACPVAGSQCKCGCLSGQQCSCASKPKPKPAEPGPASIVEFQRLQYELVAAWAKAHPGEAVYVYVNADVPYAKTAFRNSCRYDAGWPSVKTPTCVVGVYRGGEFVEVRKFPVTENGLPVATAAPPVQWTPPMAFGFGGATACRSCR